MIKELSFSGNVNYIYLTKPVLQLVKIDVNNTLLLFTIKNKTLYITKLDSSNENELSNMEQLLTFPVFYNDLSDIDNDQKEDVIITTEAPLGEVAQIKTDEKLAFAQRIIT